MFSSLLADNINTLTLKRCTIFRGFNGVFSVEMYKTVSRHMTRKNIWSHVNTMIVYKGEWRRRCISDIIAGKNDCMDGLLNNCQNNTTAGLT